MSELVRVNRRAGKTAVTRFCIDNESHNLLHRNTLLRSDPDPLDYYTAGHMMSLNLPDLKKQKADLARFVKSASGN